MATALSNGPLRAYRVVASILSYYETCSTRERVATPGSMTPAANVASGDFENRLDSDLARIKIIVGI